jgi:metallopeptidase MepB
MDKAPQRPPFFSYTPSSLTAAAEGLIAASSKVWDLVALIKPDQATFSNSIQPIIDDENERARQSRVLSFLSSASPSKEVRDASKDASIALSRDSINRHTQEDVFAVINAVSQRLDVADLPAESQLYLQRLRADFVKNGLALQRAEDRHRLRDINLRLTELCTQYIANLNADVSGLWLTQDELDGVPQATVDRLKQEDGKYWLSFKRPDMQAVMNYATSASVRQKYWILWDNRLMGSNGPLLDELLQLRQEGARLLGYQNYAESRDEDRMLSTKEALDFLSDIRGPLTELGHAELEKLAELKAAHLQEVLPQRKDESSKKAIFRWDSGYYKRLMKDQKSEIDSEKVSEYYPFQLVLPKLLEMFTLLFGLRFHTILPGAVSLSTWHQDVVSFELWDDERQGGEFKGYLFIDPYPRDGKYGHMGHFGLLPVSVCCKPDNWSQLKLMSRASPRPRGRDPTQHPR